MSIYSEFRHLSASPEYQAAIDHLESGYITKEESARLARLAIKAIIPPTPEGMMRMRECFWMNIATWGASALQSNSPYAQQKERWLRWKRESAVKAGRQYPPNALFQAAYYAPVAQFIMEEYH